MRSSRYDLYTIIGVAGKGFTGVEPGTITDIFVPTMMNPFVVSDATWFRTFVILKPGVAVESVREKLRAVFQAFPGREAKDFAGMPKQMVANFLNQRVMLEPAEKAGDFRRAGRGSASRSRSSRCFGCPGPVGCLCERRELDDFPGGGTPCTGKWRSASLSAPDERAWSNSYWWKRPSWPRWQL